MHQNAAFLGENSKILWGGPQPPPYNPDPVGRGTPLPTPNPNSFQSFPAVGSIFVLKY